MKIIATILFVLTANFEAYGFFDCVKGTEKVVEMTRIIKNVSKVRMMASVDLIIRKANSSSLSIRGPKDLVDNLVIETRGGEINLSNDKCSRNDDKLKATLYVSQLSGLALLGISDIFIADPFKSENFTIEIAGSGDVKGNLTGDYIGVNIKGAGDVNLKGEARRLNIDIMGSGDVSSLGLVAKDVDVSIKGNGDVEVHARESLKVAIFGNGDVRYQGRPKVSLKKFGGGQIKAL